MKRIPNKIENFALEVVGCRPYRCDRLDHGAGVLKPCFDPNAFFFRKRQKMIDNFKARLRRKPVDSGDVAKIVERTRRIVAKDRAGLANQSLFDPQCEFVAVELSRP